MRVSKKTMRDTALMAQVFASNPDIYYLQEVMAAFGMSKQVRDFYYAVCLSDVEIHQIAKTGDFWAIEAELEARIRCGQFGVC